MSRGHRAEYNDETTIRCERALVTLLGDIGPWRERIYLVGGLAPRYLLGRVSEDTQAHVGTTDVDLVIGLALGEATAESYFTLQTNLEKAGLKQQEPSFRWAREVEGVTVIIEFLCETSEVAPGRIFRPKGEFTGSSLSAFNVRGAQLVCDDFIECEIEGNRLDDRGRSRIMVRVANVLPYAVLKILAFQDRHENKDAYDLVYTLLNREGGARAAGFSAQLSPVAKHPQVEKALTLLRDRFRDIEQDGPSAYALFLGTPGEDEENARLRQAAVATIGQFLAGFGEAR